MWRRAADLILQDWERVDPSMERAWSSRLHKLLAIGLAFLSLLTIAAHSNEPAKGDRPKQDDAQDVSLPEVAETQPLATLPVADGPDLLQLETFINEIGRAHV